MDILRISLLGLPESGLAVDQSVPVELIQPSELEQLPVGDLVLRGTLSPMGEDYFFRGFVEGVFSGPCDRCLSEVRVPFSHEVMWHFEEGPPPSEHADGVEEVHVTDAQEEAEEAFVREECYTYQHNMIDFRPYVWEEVVLAAPTKIFCQERCQGLCPVCGGNRNIKACNCEEAQRQASTTFAGLAEMFPDLAPKKTEE